MVETFVTPLGEGEPEEDGRQAPCVSARLVDASADPVKQLRRMVAQIRAAWREAKITIREDSGICRESIMAWCGGNGVGNILGLVRDTRLAEMIADESEQSL